MNNNGNRTLWFKKSISVMSFFLLFSSKSRFLRNGMMNILLFLKAIMSTKKGKKEKEDHFILPLKKSCKSIKSCMSFKKAKPFIV